MASSLQMQIRGAVAALVASVPGLQEVHENRDFSLPTGRMNQAHVNLRRSLPADQLVYTNHPRDWSTEIELVFLTRKDNGVEAADVADSLWVGAYQAIMAALPLSDDVADVLPGEALFDEAEGDTSLCRLTWTLTVQHRTSNNTLTS